MGGAASGGLGLPALDQARTICVVLSKAAAFRDWHSLSLLANRRGCCDHFVTIHRTIQHPETIVDRLRW